MDTPRSTTPPVSPESHENKLIALALRQAEKSLEEGTASSQIITHFLRLATERERTEREKLRLENELLQKKIEAEQSSEEIRASINKVLTALKSYTVSDDDL